MEKVIIYTLDTCGYCKTIEQEFEKNNIEFENRLTNEWESEWNKVTSLTNLPATPTIYYKGSYFVPGRDFFNPENLINILSNYEKTEDVSLLHISEKIKTLNYNMSMAFGRVDQLLKQIENKLNIEEDEHKSTS